MSSESGEFNTRKYFSICISLHRVVCRGKEKIEILKIKQQRRRKTTTKNKTTEKATNENRNTIKIPFDVKRKANEKSRGEEEKLVIKEPS